MKAFNKYFDHTLLKPDATSAHIKKLCREAAEYDFYSVCVNSCYVKTAVSQLSALGVSSDVKVTSVIGFPLGAMSFDAKAYEANFACCEGAAELDMVINIGALKEGRFEYVSDDIATVVAVADEYDASVKVILETGLLTKEEIVKGCLLSMEAGASFVKTSTGFADGGATEEDILLMRKTVDNHMQIKASGGIRDLRTAKTLIAAGADRLGASASVNIMKEYESAADSVKER